MLGYTSQDIANITGGDLSGYPEERKIHSVITDSRVARPDREALFVALRGPNHNGHQYIDELYQSGIRNFLIDEDIGVRHSDMAVIKTSDTLLALQKLAAEFRKQFSGQVIAITGSNGKTIVKEWLSSLLSQQFRVSKSPLSYNSQVGVALAILQCDPKSDYIVLEAGISKPGEMERLQDMIQPDWGLITNLGDAHQEGFKSRQEKLEEKLRLFRNCSNVLYSSNQQIIEKTLPGFLEGCQAGLVSWGLSENTDYQTRANRQDEQTTIIQVKGPRFSGRFSIAFHDQASIENASHCIILSLELGLNPDHIQKQLSQLEPVEMRMQQVKGIHGCTIINDSYNSDYQSLKNAIDLLWQQSHQYDKTLILSDLQQTGDTPDEMIDKIIRIISGRQFKRVIGIGQKLHSAAKARQFLSDSYPDTTAFLEHIDITNFQNEAILLKGARVFRLEKIKDVLEEKIHRTVLRINMPALLNNLNEYRRLLHPGVKIMGMVKAFSYGSGTYEIARFLAHQKIDYLAVAFIDEGIQLRKNGVTTPIMVLNSDFSKPELLVRHELEPEIYHADGLQKLANYLTHEEIKNYPIHLKLDTGMHRLGFNYDQLRGIEDLLTRSTIMVKSIFTHLAVAGDESQDHFTDQQFKAFEKGWKYLESVLKHRPMRHVLNTSGIERFPSHQFEMVRLGIGLYGLGSEKLDGLESPLSFESYISQIHEIAPGERIGYNLSGVLPKGGKIGVIPVGYADGFDRRLGNGNWKITCKGWELPTIGQICMDMCMVDLSHTDIKEGDELTILSGREGVLKMAQTLNTIPYEIITGLSPRINRIFEFE